MLDRDGVGRWLRDGDMETLVTPPNELLEADRVSTMVNSPANNNHHCIEPFDYGDAA
jgi:putative SOS response-associated peptidase YedK